ncbi:MAG TPA: hypothetical protein VF910_01025 [Candidatus Bathyarchaeia archaeon]
MAKIRQKLDRTEWAKLTQDMQSLYVAKGNDYVLDSDDAEELRVAFERTKDDLRKANDKLAALGGIDPAEHQRLKDAATQSARDADIAKGNFQKIIEQDAAAHAEEIKKRDAREKNLIGQLRESLVDGELTRAISAYPGARHKLLMPAAKQKVDLREVGGKLRSVVLDDKGEPRLKQGAKTADEYMEPADLVAEMRNDKEYAGAFPASSGRVTDSRTLQPTPMGGGNATERAQMATIMAEIATGASKLSG